LSGSIIKLFPLKDGKSP